MASSSAVPTNTATITETDFVVPASLARYQISPAEYLAQNRGAVDHLVAAAAVIVATTTGPGSGSDDRILVLQRSRHDFAGLTWEVPGGSCEAEDTSILGAACRELYEETGLRAIGVVDVVEDVQAWIDKGSVWRKMTFLVDVRHDVIGNGGVPAVELDADEHEDFAWISEQEVLEDRYGDKSLTWASTGQKATILDAFKRFRSANADTKHNPVATSPSRD